MIEMFKNILGGNIIFALLLSFGAGVLSSFSPCIISSLPLLLTYIKGTGVKSRRQGLIYSAVYSLGLALTFTLLGVLSSIFGRMFSFASTIIYIFLAALLIISGLSILEIIPFNRSCPVILRKKRGNFGVFFLGMVSAIIASPCATPYLAAILGISAVKGNILYGTFLLLSYSLGYSVLILMAGYSASIIESISNNEKTKKAGKILKTIFGVIILSAGVYLIYLV